MIKLYFNLQTTQFTTKREHNRICPEDPINQNNKWIFMNVPAQNPNFRQGIITFKNWQSCLKSKQIPKYRKLQMYINKNVIKYIYSRIISIALLQQTNFISPLYFDSRYVLEDRTLCIRIPKTFQQLWDFIAKHIINSLYHLRLQFLEFVNAVTIQDFFEVFYIWKISRW